MKQPGSARASGAGADAADPQLRNPVMPYGRRKRLSSAPNVSVPDRGAGRGGVLSSGLSWIPSLSHGSHAGLEGAHAPGVGAGTGGIGSRGQPYIQSRLAVVSGGGPAARGGGDGEEPLASPASSVREDGPVGPDDVAACLGHEAGADQDGAQGGDAGAPPGECTPLLVDGGRSVGRGGDVDDACHGLSKRPDNDLPPVTSVPGTAGHLSELPTLTVNTAAGACGSCSDSVSGADEDNLCNLCFDGRAEVKIAGCHHMMCADCAGQLTSRVTCQPLACPFCRCSIQKFVPAEAELDGGTVSSGEANV